MSHATRFLTSDDRGWPRHANAIIYGFIDNNLVALGGGGGRLAVARQRSLRQRLMDSRPAVSRSHPQDQRNFPTSATGGRGTVVDAIFKFF